MKDVEKQQYLNVVQYRVESASATEDKSYML